MQRSETLVKFEKAVSGIIEKRNWCLAELESYDEMLKNINDAIDVEEQHCRRHCHRHRTNRNKKKATSSVSNTSSSEIPLSQTSIAFLASLPNDVLTTEKLKDAWRTLGVKGRMEFCLNGLLFRGFVKRVNRWHYKKVVG